MRISAKVHAHVGPELFGRAGTKRHEHIGGRMSASAQHSRTHTCGLRPGCRSARHTRAHRNKRRRRNPHSRSGAWRCLASICSTTFGCVFIPSEPARKMVDRPLRVKRINAFRTRLRSGAPVDYQVDRPECCVPSHTDTHADLAIIHASLARSASGLVAEYIVAMNVVRVGFPADAALLIRLSSGMGCIDWVTQ